MTKNKIEAFAGDEIIFLKGQNLVNRHRVSVKPTASGANTYLANVFDNDEVKLEVSFTLSNDEVRAYACPCPAQAVCPHVIAALIELHTEPEISAKEELLAVTGVKKPKIPKANKPRADVTYTDPGWKKVTLHFECLKTIDHEGKIVGQFQAIFENEKRERFCPLAEPNIFVVRANQITQLRMINANHTAIVIDAQLLPPAELEILRFLLNNQPDFSYTKNTDLRRSPKNTFWLSAQSVVKLVNYLKDKYQLKNNEAVRTFLETNAPAYALITRAFPRRVLYRKIRQDRYQVDLQFYVRKRWRSMIEFRHDQDGRMLLLDPEIRIWRNKQNFNVVSFSETSLPESYFFYRFEPPAQTDGIIDFKYLDDQRERDLFSLIPKAKITLEYHHARELFNHKIKYVYPGRSGFTVAAADDDPKTNVKRLWIYEKALLSALTDNDQKPRKVLFKNKKINDLKVRDLRAMRQEYAEFRQSEMATYKVVPCLTSELFITFSYDQFQSIALVNDKLAIVCRNLTLSVKEVCRMVDAYLAKKEVYIGADGYYDLTRKEAQQFCQFWAKFDFYRAENPKPGTFLFPKFRVLDLLAAFGGKLELVKQYAHPAVTEMISALKDLRFKPIAVPKPLQGVLRPYQVEGYRWVCVLFNQRIIHHV